MTKKQKHSSFINIIGRSNEFTTEEQIFNGVWFVTALFFIIIIPVNHILNSDFNHLVLIYFSSLLSISFYCVSRFLRLSLYATSISTLILIISVLFFWHGTLGGISFVFALPVMYSMIFLRGWQRYLYFFLSIGALTTLILIEYYQNDLVSSYANQKIRYLDYFFSCISILIVLGFIVKVIIERFDREKKLTNKKAYELEKANITKNKFFSIIAHDLKNPFTSLNGFSTLLREEYHQLSEPEKLNYISIINSSIDSILRLLNNLLEWSRIQTNSIEYNPIKISIYHIVEETFGLYKSHAEGKKIKMLNETEREIFVFADLNMLTIILRNLIANAIKFSYINGSVWVTTKKLNESIEITVGDIGIGIRKEVQQKIFQFEERSVTNGTSGEEGTGLGLILCKEFVIKNKGDIRVESKVGKGTKFIFTLPLYVQADNIQENKR